MSQPFVSVLMGSDSDWPTVGAAIAVLRQLQIPFEARILSAHRTPQALVDYLADAEERGAAVHIAAAGMAAHLAGTVAAHSQRPVIGVPLESGLGGLDALLATVQMPAGVPVATMAVGRAGAANAAWLAARILALGDEALATQLKAALKAASAKVSAHDRALQEKLRKEAGEAPGESPTGTV